MMRPTFSSLERAYRCPGSLALPLVNTTSPYAERGTAIHEYLEAIQGGTEPADALERVPSEWRDICAAIDLDRLPKGLAAEVAFAYDVATGKGRELGRRVGRKYVGLGPTEIAGTLDVVGVSEDAVYVLDYKAGWSELPPPAENFQLRAGGLAAARAYGKSRAFLDLARVKESGAIWKPDQAELDEFDLDVFAAELRPLFDRIKAARARAAELGEPDVALGAWCKYCPSWGACPAQKALVVRAVAVATGQDPEWAELQPTSPEQLGLAWGLAKTMARVGKQLEKRVESGLAQFGELPLPDGRVLREVIEPGDRKLDGRVVFQVVKELYGDVVAEAAIEVTATQAGIDRALKGAPKGTIPPRGRAAAERAIMKTVDERKGISRPPTKKKVEIDPAELAQAPAAEGAGPPPSPAPLPAPAPAELPAGVAGEDRPGDEVVDLEAQELAWVREQLELRALTGEADMADLHRRIMRGREKDIESWSPLLLLWGKANEILKEREQKEAS